MKTETFSKQAPIAIAAVMDHAIKNDLSISNVHIDTDSYEQRLDVCLFGLNDEDHARWINSLIIEGEENEATESGSVRTKWDVRLPDQGLGFRLVTYRPAPLLAVVTA